MNDCLKYVASILFQHGFSRKGVDFLLHKNDEITCIINIQKSKVNICDIGTKQVFTLNWGIYLSIYNEFYNLKPNSISFKNCIINGRISGLRSLKEDIWWKNTGDQCRECDAEEIQHLLLNYGIPFLTLINTIQDIIDVMHSSKTNGIFANKYCINYPNAAAQEAVLYGFLNQKDKSDIILDEIINASDSTLYRENIQLLKYKIHDFVAEFRREIRA